MEAAKVDALKTLEKVLIKLDGAIGVSAVLLDALSCGSNTIDSYASAIGLLESILQEQYCDIHDVIKSLFNAPKA